MLNVVFYLFYYLVLNGLFVCVVDLRFFIFVNVFSGRLFSFVRFFNDFVIRNII